MSQYGPHVGRSGAWHEPTDEPVYVGRSGAWIQGTEVYQGSAGAWVRKWVAPLAAPTAFTATAQDYQTLRFAFTASTSLAVESYRVYYRAGASMAGSKLNADGYVDLTTNPEDVAIFTEATTYYVAAVAMRYGEESDLGTETSETTPLAAPSTGPTWANSTPKDNTADDDGILLQVLAPDATSVDVYYRVGSSMDGDPEANGTLLTGATIPVALIQGTDYLHSTGQAHGTEVFYQARGRNSGGPGPFGLQDSAIVVKRAPGAPTSVYASRSGDVATITWTQPSPDNETLYLWREYYRTSPSGSWVLGATGTNPQNDTNMDRALIEGRQYYWEIAAQNEVGTSAYAVSEEVTYVDTPGTPTSVALDYDGTNPDSELILSWTAPASGGAFDSYQIEIVPYSSSFSGTANGSSGNDTSERLTGLGDDTRYKARLRAISSVWGTTGAWSDQADEWTAPSTLSAPSLTVTATSDSELELDAGTVADVDEYAFYDAGGTLLGQQASDVYNRGGLSAGTQYGQYVKAVNAASVGSPHSDTYSAPSSTVNRYTLVDVPQSFSAARDAAECPLHRFDISWSNANGDGVSRSETMTLERDDGTGYSAVDTGVTAGTTSLDNVVGVAGTVAFRLKYNNSESSYAEDRNLGPPCPE